MAASEEPTCGDAVGCDGAVMGGTPKVCGVVEIDSRILCGRSGIVPVLLVGTAWWGSVLYSPPTSGKCSDVQYRVRVWY